jgi:phosphomannomutase
MLASVSGIRGIFNKDLSLTEISDFANNFARYSTSNEVLLARDTRRTGDVINRTVVASMLSRGLTVMDYGVISTPALFRESRLREKPAMMISASHNEPEFNGLKFIIDGFGIGQKGIDAVLARPTKLGEAMRQGRVKLPRATYNDELIARFGQGSCEGMKVALDMGGGAAISHANPILKALGCEVFSINDVRGVFGRRIDPFADRLLTLQRLVTARGCEIGLGFDCDGDRLAIVDSKGEKRSGDFMLSLALSRLLPSSENKRVVVSTDTTVVVDEIVKREGGQVFRSRVGEANVVAQMREKDARFGGEGSSGGLIDGSFNYCRDSMLAALTIIRSLRDVGPRLYDEVRSLHQARLGLHLSRPKAEKAIKLLSKRYRDSDLTDGVKITLSDREWVLIRPSGTEELVRISAEAEGQRRAGRIAEEFAAKVEGLSG